MPWLERAGVAEIESELTGTAASTAVAAEAVAWRQGFLRLAVSAHLYFVAFMGVNAVFPLYIKEFPGWQIGLLSGVLMFASMVARPISGVALDARRSPGFWMAFGAGLSGVGIALTLVKVLPLLFVSRLAFGVGIAFFETSALTLLTGLSTGPVRGRWIGMYQVNVNGPQTYAPLVAFLMVGAADFSLTFLLGLVVVLLALVMVPAKRGGELVSLQAPVEWRRWFVGKALLPSGLVLPMAIMWGAIFAFLPLLAEERPGGAGEFFAVYGGTAALLRLVAGPLSDRLGRRTVAVPGMAAAALSMFALGASSHLGAFFAAALLAGVGHAFAHTASLALTMDRASEGERGAMLGTFSLLLDGATFVSAAALGVVASLFGVTAVFRAAALVCAATLALPVAETLRRQIRRRETAGRV